MRARCVMLALMLCVVPLAHAQPDPTLRVGRTVADEVLPTYRFERLSIVSADGQHRYRVHLAVPRTTAPAAGFPVAYLLDGNAALMELDAGLLQRLSASKHPPVLALIAHDNDLRIDGTARTFDYTPRRGEGTADEFDASNGERRSGGAEAFLDLIETRIKPAVAARVSVDDRRQMIWGHSYGGLFVLQTLLTRPGAFSTYAAVDPSLWWGDGFIVKAFESLASTPVAQPARLLLLRGGPAEGAAVVRQGPHAARGAGNAEAGKRLAAVLAGIDGLMVEEKVLPGQSHGQTLGASIAPALQAFADY